MWELIYVTILLILFSDSDFQKLVNGHPEQISRLYHERKGVILAFLLRKFKGNRDYAEDVLSMTYEAVCTAVASLKENKNLTGWLIAIAFKKYCKYVKKLHNERTKTEKSILDQPSNDLDDKRLIIYTAMQMLHDDHRTILEMRYYERKSQKEIAAFFHKPESAIETILIRAKKALKNAILHLESRFSKEGYQ
ncbi:MAG: RNA polymerase sigma factor [Chitinivibrionales bacterium]|nr:RNA polymerase sigma factor [Chitinivibrionales bacterium]